MALSEGGGPDMKSMIKKAIALIMFAALTLSLTACTGSEPDLEISQMASAEAQAIMGVISNTGADSAAELLAMKDDRLEDLLWQNGFDIDGSAFRNGLDGWHSMQGEFGDILAISEPVMSSNDKEIIAEFDIQGSNRTGKCVIVIDDRDRITSITTSADYTLAENMEKAGLNTLLGMGTTFAILIFLSLIISLFKLIPGSGGMKEKVEKKAAPLDNAVSQIAEREAIASENEIEDGELVAVITAAIAAYQASTGSTAGSDGFVVRSIRRHY